MFAVPHGDRRVVTGARKIKDLVCAVWRRRSCFWSSDRLRPKS